MKTPPELKGVKFEFEKADKEQDRVFRELASGFIGEKLEGDVWEEFKAKAVDFMDVSPALASDVLIPWYRCDFTAGEANAFSCRIACTTAALKKGEQVATQFEPGVEWVPCIVSDVIPWRSSMKGTSRVFVSFICLGKKYGGLKIGMPISYKFVKKVLPVLFGCPRFIEHKVKDIVQFRAVGRIHTADKGTRITEFYCPPGAIVYNKKLYKRRQKKPCLMGFKLKCSECSIGYTGKSLNSCPYATHSCAYEKKPCTNCQKIGWFDTARPNSKLCIACEVLRIKREERKHVASPVNGY